MKLKLKTIGNFCVTKKYLRFYLAVTKILLTFVTVKAMRGNSLIRVRRISSPELIKLRWAYFYAHITASL